MKKFWELNKYKFKFGFFFISVCFLSLTSILLIFCYFNNQFPTWKLLLSILIYSGILLPALISSFSVVGWIHERNQYQEILKRTPLNQLENIGFKYVKKDEGSKWNYTTEILTKTTDGYQVRFEIYKNEAHFTLFTNRMHINQLKYDSFKAKCKALDFEVLFLGAFQKTFKLKKIEELEIDTFEFELNKFIGLLKEYNFTAETI